MTLNGEPREQGGRVIARRMVFPDVTPSPLPVDSRHPGRRRRKRPPRRARGTIVERAGRLSLSAAHQAAVEEQLAPYR